MSQLLVPNLWFNTGLRDVDGIFNMACGSIFEYLSNTHNDIVFGLEHFRAGSQTMNVVGKTTATSYYAAGLADS